MSVLVTGGAGYIGSHTCVELIAAGFNVVVVDNFSNSYYEALQRVEKITGKKITVYEADLCNKSSLEAVFEKENINSVIHFAGLKAVGESVAKPLMYYQNNLVSTLNLLDCMQQFNVNELVFSSSATVYGDPVSVPIDEGFALSATNPYGQSKLMIEHMIQDFCAANSGFKAVLLRYFNPVGAHESGMIGEHPQGIPNNLMPYITQVAIGQREQLQVFGSDYKTPDGTGVRDYIHVVDLSQGHVKALEAMAKITGAEAINLGTGQGYSVLDMVKAFERVNAVAIPYSLVERRPGDIASCYANATKAEQLLGWKAAKNLDDMMRDAWRWQSSNPEGYC
jgi:UDP-glucose 4-epimerase